MSEREYIVQLDAAERRQLIEFLERPNGSSECFGGRVIFEAVERGGVLVRTAPFSARRPVQPAWPNIVLGEE